MEKGEYRKMYELENRHFWFVGKRFFIDAFLNRILQKDLKILDIGSGTGGLTKYLNRYGDVVGLEKNDYACRLGKSHGLKIIKGEAESLPFGTGKFNLVTCLDVLYHRDVKDLDKVLIEIVRVLKKGGYFLMTDSAFEFLKSGHDVVLGGQRRFSLPQLENLLIKHNLEVIRASYIYFCLFPLVFLKRLVIDRLFGRKMKSDVSERNSLINSLLLAVIRMEAVFLKYISYPAGSSVIILARKK